MSTKQTLNEGALLVPFVRLFTVEPSLNNKGQLLLRKEEIKDGTGLVAQGLIAVCFFNCGLSYGAQVPCASRQEQDKLFDALDQEDADAIARQAYREILGYLERISKGAEVKVEAKTIKLPGLDKI